MRINALLAVTRDSLYRHRRFWPAAMLGVSAGVAVALFFLALGLGVERHIMAKLFDDLPDTRLKISATSFDLGPFNLAKPGFLKGARLTDALVEKLAAEPGVERAFGEMAVGFPIKITGRFFGQRVATDLVATGIDPVVIAPDLDDPSRFAVREDGALPVVISPHLLDLYNSAFAPMNGFPMLDEKALLGFRFDLVLGRSYLGGVAERGRVRTVQCEVVGFSRNAVSLGITLPLPLVRRWNAEFTDATPSHRAIYLDAKRPEDVERLQRWLEKSGYRVETAKEGLSRRIGDILNLVTGLLAFLAGIILFLGMLNVGFVMSLLVSRRRREIGLWRSLGATRAEMAGLVLIEAACIGLCGSLVGSGIGYAATCAFDAFLRERLTALPFPVDSLFAYSPELWVGVIATGCLTVLVAALLPAWRAARLDPISALRR